MWGVLVFMPILFAVQIFLPTVIASWKDVIYGSLLVVIIIFRPYGVIDRKLIRSINNNITKVLKKITRFLWLSRFKGNDRR